MSIQEQRKRAESASRAFHDDWLRNKSGFASQADFWLAAEAAAIERCAKVCNEVAEEFGPGDWQNASLQCSATIRALLPKE